jgi:hypothetical protein
MGYVDVEHSGLTKQGSFSGWTRLIGGGVAYAFKPIPDGSFPLLIVFML